MKKGSILGPAKSVRGEIKLPGDKSISHRAIMLGSLAEGVTCIKGLLDCDDCNYTMRAFRDMGVPIDVIENYTTILGKGLRSLRRPAGPVNAGNSGTTMRILAGILAGQRFEVMLTGEPALSGRPMNRIITPLSLMGTYITSLNGGYPPLRMMGGSVKAIKYDMPVPSAQVKSAILFAGLYSNGVTTVTEKFKSRDHTERMMKYFGADVRVNGLSVSVKGARELKSRAIEVPADISSAGFFMVAASLLEGSKVKIRNVTVNPTRAGIIEAMSRMGAHISIDNRKELFEPVADITVEYAKTKGITIDESMIPSIIDELPVIFVLAALSEGRTVIKGVKELTVKETNRIESMKHNLSKMGAHIKTSGSNVIIEGVKELKGASLKSFGDHRTCMSMAIASLAAKDESVIDDVECVSKSLPGFFDILDDLKG
jgi:3-phosphoshikimate 1-carboxyvinyltransferase